MAAIGGGTATG